MDRMMKINVKYGQDRARMMTIDEYKDVKNLQSELSKLGKQFPRRRELIREREEELKKHQLSQDEAIRDAARALDSAINSAGGRDVADTSKEEDALAQARNGSPFIFSKQGELDHVESEYKQLEKNNIEALINHNPSLNFDPDHLKKLASSTKEALKPENIRLELSDLGSDNQLTAEAKNNIRSLYHEENEANQAINTINEALSQMKDALEFVNTQADVELLNPLLEDRTISEETTIPGLKSLFTIPTEENKAFSPIERIQKANEKVQNFSKKADMWLFGDAIKQIFASKDNKLKKDDGTPYTAGEIFNGQHKVDEIAKFKNDLPTLKKPKDTGAAEEETPTVSHP